MSELEEKLNALFSNPQLMQQIASMAQAMGAEGSQNAPEPKEAPVPSIPALDPKLIQTIAKVGGSGGVDKNQKALLHALSPYLSNERVHKLERAMQAAKLAGAASAFLNAGGLQMLSGR